MRWNEREEELEIEDWNRTKDVKVCWSGYDPDIERFAVYFRCWKKQRHFDLSENNIIFIAKI